MPPVHQAHLDVRLSLGEQSAGIRSQQTRHAEKLSSPEAVNRGFAAIALAMKQTDSAGAHNADQLRQRVLIHNELARREMPLGHRVRQSVSFARRKVAEQVDLA